MGIPLVSLGKTQPMTTCKLYKDRLLLLQTDRLFRILGGGTAGLTIAGRLAANPKLSVAVIEAGGFYEIDNGNGSVIPGFAPTQHVGPQPEDTQPLIDWSFVTTPQAVRHEWRLAGSRL